MKHIRKDPDGIIHYTCCHDDRAKHHPEGGLIFTSYGHTPVWCGVDPATGEIFERDIKPEDVPT